MKKLAVLLFVPFFFACESVNDVVELLPSMKATIDGEEWVGSVRTVNQVNDNFIITGTSITGEIITLTAFGTDEGTYGFLADPAAAAVYKESASASTDDTYIGSSGTIVITSIDTGNQKISGTFEFTVTRLLSDNKTISNGTFTNLSYNISE
jgi:hypothetical protein